MCIYFRLEVAESELTLIVHDPIVNIVHTGQMVWSDKRWASSICSNLSTIDFNRSVCHSNVVHREFEYDPIIIQMRHLSNIFYWPPKTIPSSFEFMFSTITDKKNEKY